MIECIPLSEIDGALVEKLLDSAFGKDRHQRTAYRIRDGVDALEGLSFAAVDNGVSELLGTVQCWPVALTGEDGATHPMIMVGPVAVHPDVQGRGVGKLLVEIVLAAHGDAPSLPLMMIGDPEYYGRFFGFDSRSTGGWKTPGPVERNRLLARDTDGKSLPKSGTLGPWPG